MYEEIKTSIIWFAIVGVIFSGILIALNGGSRNFVRQSLSTTRWGSRDYLSNCRQTSENYYSCTDETTQEKAKNVTWYYYYEVQTITATVTAYSAEESPGINARGFIPRVGYSVACPRSLHLGTRLQIEGQVGSRICDDRTALRYDGRFDIFVGSRKEAMKWGIRRLSVTIIYK